MLPMLAAQVRRLNKAKNRSKTSEGNYSDAAASPAPGWLSS